MGCLVDCLFFDKNVAIIDTVVNGIFCIITVFAMIIAESNAPHRSVLLHIFGILNYDNILSQLVRKKMLTEL